ncbi:MAG: Crp/Fnr family transcriptional regulator [Halioglobus sp.]
MIDARAREAVVNSAWFQDLPDTAIDALATAAQIKPFPVNSFIYSQGEKTTELYCIISGRVRVSVSGINGQEFAIIDRENGAWFGEPCLVDDEPRVIDARVIAPSEILVIPRSVVRNIADQNPIIYKALFTHTFLNTRGLYQIIAGILFSPLKVRVAGRLLHLIEEHGVAVEGGYLIDIKVSQNDFARLALGSRQRINGVFSEWRARGLLETREDHLFIKDIEGIRADMEISE